MYKLMFKKEGSEPVPQYTFNSLEEGLEELKDIKNETFTLLFNEEFTFGKKYKLPLLYEDGINSRLSTHIGLYYIEKA